MRAVDVVVVGAGLAGLTAAREVERVGRTAVVLEARDRVGGRTKNTELAGMTVEIGGQWVGPGQDRVNALIDELGLERFPTFDEGDTVIEFADGTIRRMTGEVPPVGPLGVLDLLRAQRALEKVVGRIDLDRPWATPGAESLDATTFATWLERTVRTTKALDFWNVAIDAVFAAPAANMSALHVLTYLRAGGGLDRLLATTGGAQQDRVAGGSALIAERLAEQVADVRLSTPVTAIDWSADGVTVRTHDGEVRGARAVVALPPALAGRLAYEPALPAARDLLTQRLPAGYVIKMMAAYDRPFWRDEGIAGAASARGPVSAVFDNSLPGDDRGVLLGFIESDEGRAWGARPEAERRAAFLDALGRLVGPMAGDPVATVELDWAAEPFTRGCYGAHFPTGVWTQFGPALRDPVGPIHWAGTETATEWMGYMDGAIESGERAATEALGSL